MRILPYIIILLLTSSCATKSLKLGADEAGWKTKQPSNASEIYHSIYLIGDVGGSPADTSTIPLMEIEKHLLSDGRADDATDVVFLGDNIYPVGMPPVGHSDRDEAEHKLNMQLESVRKFEGNVTFIPGNHDWYTYGREGLRRQEVYIEKFLSRHNESFTDYFRPSDGCGDVEVMKIAKDIALITIDSHWFLTNKPKKEDYSDCKIKTRSEFATAFHDTIQALKGTKIMLTMHHPMYTVGSHGGFYNWYSHIAPLTEYKKKIRIPMLGIGSLVNYFRPRISEQDTKSAPYKNYRATIIPDIQEHGQTIVAAGHEHSLQYNKVAGVDYIVSGSGSKRGPTGQKPYTKFAYGNYGYALVDYYTDGSTWLSFYANNEEDTKFVEIYRSKLK